MKHVHSVSIYLYKCVLLIMIKKEVIEFVLAHHKCREKQFSKLFNEFYLEIQQIKFTKEFVFNKKRML